MAMPPAAGATLMGYFQHQEMQRCGSWALALGVVGAGTGAVPAVVGAGHIVTGGFKGLPFMGAVRDRGGRNGESTSLTRLDFLPLGKLLARPLAGFDAGQSLWDIGLVLLLAAAIISWIVLH